MKKLSLLAFLILLLGLTARAQTNATANLTAQAASCPTTGPGSTTSSIIVAVKANQGGYGINLSGTFSGTVSFFGTTNGTSGWSALAVTPLAGGAQVTTATAVGNWQVNSAAVQGVCVLVTTYTSGTVVASISSSTASARSGGGSSAGGTVTSVSGTANQVDVATGTTTPVISLDPAITLPGSLTVPTGSSITTSGTGTNNANQVNGSVVPASSNNIVSNVSSQLVAGTGHNTSATLTCAAASGSGTTYTCNTSPSFVPADGDIILFQADLANTGASTLSVNGQAGPPGIKKQGGGTALVANDMLAGQDSLMEFDGVNWQMQGQSGNPAAAGTVTSVATTAPITGGTITSTGTIACPTCVTSSSPGAGIAHFAGSTQAVTSSPVALASDVSGQLPIGAVGSSGLSGTAPITISAAGAIACATCSTNSSQTPVGAPQIAGASGAFVPQSNTIVVNGGAGAIGALTLANNEHVVLSANDTETATISNALNGLVIEGVAPTISITRQTASTGIFNLSGNDTVLRQLTLDGGSVATPLPLVQLSGNRPLMEKIIPQNAGTTSPAKAIILVTAGTGGKFLDLYYPSDSDTGIYLLPSASATIQDVWIERFLFASHAPATNLCAIDGNDGAASSAIKDIHFVENTVYMNSANASGICFHGQTIANDASPSPNHFWDKNLVVPLANGIDAYHIFVQSRDSFTNNMYEDYNAFTVANPYTFGDSYNSKFIGNDCHNQKGSNLCYKWTDFQGITVLGNNARGLGGTTNFQYSWTSTSGVGSNSLIANNSCRLDQTNAGTCYRFQAASGTFNMLDNLFIGNTAFGTSTVGQVGLQLTDTTGTLGGFYAADNHFNLLATGINVGAGVTNPTLENNFYDGVTSPVSDSGTGTRFSSAGPACTPNVTPVGPVGASSTADGNLMVCNLRASDLNTLGKTLKVKGYGLYSNAVTEAPTLNVKVKLCTVSGCGSGTVINLFNVTTTATSATATTNAAWQFEVQCTTQTTGATAAFECHGNVAADLSNVVTNPDTFFTDTTTATIGTIDATAALVGQTTLAFSVSNAGNAATERMQTTEFIN